MKYAIVDTAAGKVINTIEYDPAPSNPPPGFEQWIIAIQSDKADVSWSWDGINLVPPVVPTPAPAPQTVFSQDLMAQFTVDDAAKIQAAISGNVQFWLLWSAMQAQKDPMIVTNARFKAGWAALVQVLGAPRMTAIATALGVAIT